MTSPDWNEYSDKNIIKRAGPESVSGERPETVEEEVPENRSAVIDVSDLSVGYGKHTVLEDLNFSAAGGSIITIIGPNGAGKSTLLKTLIRQLEPKGGTVYLNGKNLFKMEEKAVAKAMSIVMTERVHPELLTCEDIVSFGRFPYTGRMGIPAEHDRNMIREAMELADIEDLKDRYFTEVSDGQRQRVMLARAICQDPEIMILDEPLSFLDIRFKLEWLRILKELAMKKGIAVLMTLHELDLAQKISDRVICVRDGGIVFEGTPDEVFTKDRIEWLYDLREQNAENGSYLPAFGSLELGREPGAPAVFVIGGAGSGIPVYRQLWREGVPFAAGVISSGDLDYPVAEALAQTVITSAPFEPISEADIQAASQILKTCSAVICTLDPACGFGTMNARSRELLKLADNLMIPVKYEIQ